MPPQGDGATARRPRPTLPGWIAQLLTHPVKGLESYRQLFEYLTSAKSAIKVYCEVAEP